MKNKKEALKGLSTLEGTYSELKNYDLLIFPLTLNPISSSWQIHVTRLRNPCNLGIVKQWIAGCITRICKKSKKRTLKNAFEGTCLASRASECGTPKTPMASEWGTPKLEVASFELQGHFQFFLKVRYLLTFLQYSGCPNVSSLGWGKASLLLSVVSTEAWAENGNRIIK